MTRYVMVADLERCVGCQTCTAACRHANATSPSVQWRRVLDIETGSYPDVGRTFVPVGCQHCGNPPCMHVCPTTATRKRDDGIVTIDYDLCIGCAYCDVACPYQARFKVDRADFAYHAAMENELMRSDERRVGVSQKCTFCSDRIDFAKKCGLVPGIDPQATPACVNACIADALHFGDMEDPDSNVSRLLKGNSHFRMHAELGTEPNFYYLDARRHGQQQPGATAPTRGEHIEPRHQKHWDWKAASNFILGGSGSFLLVLSCIYAMPVTAAVALALIALGLGMLLFKIGRPLRFLYVLRQPQRSWMSREAWIAAILFPSGFLFVFSQSRWAAFAAATTAVLFLFAQAMILKESKGVPAWRTAHVTHLIVLTGMAEGTALFCFFHPLPAVLLAFTVARWLSWLVYRSNLGRDGAPERTLDVLDSERVWMLWSGLIAPLALAVLGFLDLAAAAVLASGYHLKFILVTRAAYQQGFAISKGADVVRPGWTSWGNLHDKR